MQYFLKLLDVQTLSPILLSSQQKGKGGGSNGRTARRFFSKLTDKLHLFLSRCCVGVTSRAAAAAAAAGGPLLWPGTQSVTDAVCRRRRSHAGTSHDGGRLVGAGVLR